MLLAQIESNRLASMITDGLSLGSIYALLAMGFVIIFKATQVLNFAHGALAGFGAFMVASYATIYKVPARWMPEAPGWLTWSLSVVLALATAALLGMILERLFVRPMVGEALFAVAIVTLGVDIVVRNITNDFLGTNARPMGDPWGTKIAGWGPFRMPHTEIVQIVSSIVLVVAVWAFFRSRVGVAMRATAFDQEAARAQGINVGRIFSISWGIGAVLAAIAGLFISLFPRRATGVDPTTAFFAFKAFPAIILGGLDSVPGAVVGGFAVGMAEAAATAYLGGFESLGSGFGGIVPYLLMMVVLLIRPHGLFGTEEIRRV